MPLAAALVLAAGPAIAQDADEANGDDDAAAEDETDSDEDDGAGVGPITTDDADRDVDLVEAPSPDTADADGEVIEVTGTLIRREELTTAAPLTVMDRSDIDSTGEQSIGDVLQQLPSQAEGTNTQVNNGGTGATRVNMRGLGTQRTLVLVNGRRHVPSGTGADSSVDLNSIPMAVIERVEVLKDGASAIYGTDAIGGVVNIITRDDFDGTEINLFTGTSQGGGGTTYDASVLTGADTDRGNVVFSAGFSRQQDMWTYDRDWAEVDWSLDWGSCELSDDGRCLNVNDVIVPQGSPGTPEGQIGAAEAGIDRGGNPYWQQLLEATGGEADLHLDPDEGWRAFSGPNAINYPGFTGDAYNYQPYNYLVTPQNRYNLYSQGNYDLHDRVSAFFEGSFVSRRSEQLIAPEPLTIGGEGLTVSPDNIYNPFGRGISSLLRRVQETGGRVSEQDVNTSRLVFGLEGQLPEAGTLENWYWNASFNFGRTSATQMNHGNFDVSRIQNAIGPSYIDDAGEARCGTPDNPGDEACVPLDLFGGYGTITDDMLDYISFSGVDRGYNRQTGVQGNITGQLMETPWGGDVSLALGTEFRDLAGGFQPDPNTASGDVTGPATDPTEGTFNVTEGYAEISALPVVGKTAAEWLELSAAARVFNYSTFGTDWTWETGGLWTIDQGFSLRSTFSTAFRAPGVSALFGGSTEGFPVVPDPCSQVVGQLDDDIVNANCSADDVINSSNAIQERSTGGGNPDLEPETANIFTVGTVYEPTFVDNLAFTADYYNISIRNQIGGIGAGLLVDLCYGEEHRGAGLVPGVDACDRIHRVPETNEIDFIENPLSNLGPDSGIDTQGIDVGARYTYQTPVGAFSHNLDANYLLQFDTQQVFEPEGGEPIEQATQSVGVFEQFGGGAQGMRPRYRFNLNTMWGHEEFGAGTNIRYTHSVNECAGDNCQALFDDDADNPPHRRVSPNVTADLFGSYRFDGQDLGVGQSEFTVGVNNVLNRPPEVVYNGFTSNSHPAAYDFMGRYFYVRFTQSL